MVNLHHNISNSYILLLLLWMYLHSATSPEKEVGGTGQMTWSKSPPLHQFRHSSHTCAPGHPRTTFFLIGRYDCGKESPHRRQVSLVQFYVAASSVPFWSSLSPFSADENKATRLIETPYQLNSVVSLGRETSVWIFLLTAPRLSNVLLQRAHVMDRLHL